MSTARNKPLLKRFEIALVMNTTTKDVQNLQTYSAVTQSIQQPHPQKWNSTS